MIKKLLLLSFGLLLIFGCKNNIKKDNVSDNNKYIKSGKYDYYGDKLIITDKIMYDVTISNDMLTDRTKNNPDWFWENIPEQQCNEFIATLLNDAKSGKLPIYYYDITGDYESFDRVKPENTEKFMDSILTYNYQILDSTSQTGMIINKKITLDYKNVKKLRFLEEWFIGDGGFYKKVIAVAPFFKIEVEGMYPINSVYFWILVNNDEIKL